MTTVLNEDFTGTNGSAPNATTFVTSVNGASAVVDIQSNQLRLLLGPGTSAARAITRDASGANFSLTDVETLILWDPGATLFQQYAAVCLRTDNTWDATAIYSPTNGYNIEFNPLTAAELQIYKVVAGTNTPIVTGSFGCSAATKAWMRCQAVGTTIRVKMWNNGTAEPSAWTLSTTDSSFTSGGVQIRNYLNSNRSIAIDQMSIDDTKLWLPPPAQLQVASSNYRV